MLRQGTSLLTIILKKNIDVAFIDCQDVFKKTSDNLSRLLRREFHVAKSLIVQKTYPHFTNATVRRLKAPEDGYDIYYNTKTPA